MTSRLGTSAAMALAGATIILATTAGCTATSPAPTPRPTPTPTGSAPVATGEATPAPSPPPTLRPTLAAGENRAYFDAVNLAVVAANPSAGGRDFIDALVAAGFDKSQMEVTADRTTVDLEADSVQFAVLFQGECLIGQYGSGSGGYQSALQPPLGTGGCLVGDTRPIDW
ncbi:hypothetical protein [Agromyces sp. NPDC049794]|uniref:DUF6993 domain-containing protein n=1 Tax=unclassified Agromyces TaxID=2639701 RepID=UPI0033EC489E